MRVRQRRSQLVFLSTPKIIALTGCSRSGCFPNPRKERSGFHHVHVRLDAAVASFGGIVWIRTSSYGEVALCGQVVHRAPRELFELLREPRSSAEPKCVLTRFHKRTRFSRKVSPSICISASHTSTPHPFCSRAWACVPR